MQQSEKSFLTVTQLNSYVKMLMDGDSVLSAVAVTGEISNFKNHYASGHLYFSLKDQGALIRCVMFRSSAARLSFAPSEGARVNVWGRVSVYPQDGSYQLYVSAMTPAGEGDLLAAFLRLKEKLAAEGLFDQSRKKPLPKFPRTVGIVTSDTGAAVRDMLNILGRRFPAADVLLYPALVQGAGAPADIIRGIRRFNAKKDVDVIIIGRGGGSGEDLAAFNDEALARVIAASEIPVISAVGHETDFTISDFVADLRAPTPSAAAELAVPDSDELRRYLDGLLGRCENALGGKLEFLEARLAMLSGAEVLRSPGRFLDIRKKDVERLSERMSGLFAARLDREGYRLGRAAAGLEAMSPLGVLGRGYGVLQKGDEYIGGVSGLEAGDVVRIRMNDGTAVAEIISKEAGNG